MMHNAGTKELSGLFDSVNTLGIFDAMYDGIMIVDADYRILYYNNAMAKIEGFRSEEVVGKQLLDIFPYQTYEKNTLMQAVKEDKPFHEIIQSYVTSKGRQVTVITSSLPIKSGDRIVGGIEITKDISKAKSLTEKVIELQEKLNKASTGEQGGSSRAGGCHYCFDEIIGDSGSIKKAKEYAKKTASTSSTVLINGETGTGKEMFAQSIHNRSIRRDKPYVAINCAALPGDLLEGLLFGTVKGGFTGSIDRPGLFEQANGGTLLLDEIDSMDKNLQAKLLRVLQEGCVRRVGAVRDIELDIRFISTTNSNLAEAMERGTFRSDLYYRLSVVNITVPPLRERDGDIAIFLDFFRKEYNRLFYKQVQGFSPEVLDLFQRYSWPGNIRELKHCIEGIMNIIGEEKIITPELLPEHILDFKTLQNERPDQIYISIETLNEKVNAAEKASIMTALTESKGNVSKAADLLGIKRQALQYKMTKYGISKDQYSIRWTEME